MKSEQISPSKTLSLPLSEEKLVTTVKFALSNQDLIDLQTQKISLGSKIYRQRKGKLGSGSETTELDETKQSATQANYIPFSQRQSKSAVASYQAMKKRNKDKQAASSSKAERMIAETMKEYNQ